MNYELLSENPDLVMHLQDDWLSTEPLTHYFEKDPFGRYENSYGIFDFFEKFPNAGYIRLRSNVWSKVSNEHRITKRPIKWKYWGTKYPKIGRIITSNAHFTFNPTIIKASVMKNLLPVDEELDAMIKYHDMGLVTAQLRANCFMHIGDNRAIGEGGRWIK